MLTTPFNAPRGSKWKLWIPTIWFLLLGLPGLGAYMIWWAFRAAQRQQNQPRMLPAEARILPPPPRFLPDGAGPGMRN